MNNIIMNVGAELTFYFNTGTIPAEIGNLEKLQVLGLQNNYLTNTIPEQNKTELVG